MPRQIANIALAPQARAKSDDSPAIIHGYGAVFYDAEHPEGTQYHLWGDFYERIKPGAFDAAIRGENDVRSLFNHDPNIVLGRAESKTLELRVDKKGLAYEVSPPDTQLVRDQVIEPITRGDVSGASIMFIATSVVWREEKTPDGRELDIREIEGVELWEVGPVVFPAYSSTSTGLRCYSSVTDEIREQLAREHREFHRLRRQQRDKVKMRWEAVKRSLTARRLA